MSSSVLVNSLAGGAWRTQGGRSAQDRPPCRAPAPRSLTVRRAVRRCDPRRTHTYLGTGTTRRTLCAERPLAPRGGRGRTRYHVRGVLGPVARENSRHRSPPRVSLGFRHSDGLPGVARTSDREHRPRGEAHNGEHRRCLLPLPEERGRRCFRIRPYPLRCWPPWSHCAAAPPAPAADCRPRDDTSDGPMCRGADDRALIDTVTDLVIPPRKRPGRPLLVGEKADNAERHRVRARVGHEFPRTENLKILRGCRQHGDGLHHAVQNHRALARQRPERGRA